ncbi:MAG: hypothetical protein MJE66_06125, partial [Proteobacteria bacterium]|nr:hypothetical protein [Pseudomonadota bacterium]
MPASTPPARRLVLVSLLLALVLGVVGVVAIVAAELAVRPYRGLTLRVEGDGWGTAADPEIGFAPAARSSIVRHHLDSGLRYNVHSDSRGLRVDGPGEETPERVDLLAIGGSFTWGHGVENAETYPQILGRTLGIKVANAAYA